MLVVLVGAVLNIHCNNKGRTFRGCNVTVRLMLLMFTLVIASSHELLFRLSVPNRCSYQIRNNTYDDDTGHDFNRSLSDPLPVYPVGENL